MENLTRVADQLKKIIDHDKPPQTLEPKFRYIHQNVLRMVGNLQYIFQNGIYPKFTDLPACPQDESCS